MPDVSASMMQVLDDGMNVHELCYHSIDKDEATMDIGA